MFNVPILDVWHVWEGCGRDGGKGPEIGDEGDVHCLQNGLMLSQAKCLVL